MLGFGWFMDLTLGPNILGFGMGWFLGQIKHNVWAQLMNSIQKDTQHHWELPTFIFNFDLGHTSAFNL